MVIGMAASTTACIFSCLGEQQHLEKTGGQVANVLALHARAISPCLAHVVASGACVLSELVAPGMPARPSIAQADFFYMPHRHYSSILYKAS